MTGIIVSIPPTTSLPPSSNPNNPVNLPGVTYQYALLTLPQTWGAKQTFPLGDISLHAADILDLAPSATIDTTNASNITSGTLSAARLPGASALVQVTTTSQAIAAGTSAVAIVRASPVTTALTLPTVASQLGIPVHVFDWSSAVSGHTITVTPNGAETIMLAANWQIFSNSASLGSATFYPSTALSGWYIAP